MKSRIRYFFKSLQIKTKIMLGMLLIILLLSIWIGNLTYYVSREFIKKNTMELTTELLNQYAENIDNKSISIKKLAFQASKEILNSDVFLHRKSYGKSIEHIFTRYFNDMISQHRSSNEYIEAVYMKTNDQYNYWWYKDLENKYAIDQEELEEMLFNFNKEEQMTLWLPTKNRETVVYISKMISPDTLVTHGLILLFINKDYFLTLDTHDCSIISNDKIAIIKEDGCTLVSGAQQRKNNKDYFIVSARVKNENWKLIAMISNEDLLQGAYYLRTLIMIVCVVISIIAIIIAYIIAEGVTKNIRLLEKNMQRVEDGDFNVRVKPSTYDEVGLLTLRFNYMIKKINELIHTAYIEKMQKQEAEFEVLKAQINPHFLYNTLGSVKWLSRMKGEKKIEEMVDALIYILRASIKGNKYITIEDELHYVNKYIELQKIRFENRFKVMLNVSEGIKECYTLQFILQPLVENALYHGIEMSKGNGMITINGYEKDHTIHLEVVDNGVGIAKEQLEKITHRDQTKYSGLNSIGLANINKRIKMYFGATYGITIDSQIGKGTSVSVLLPYINEKPEIED